MLPGTSAQCPQRLVRAAAPAFSNWPTCLYLSQACGCWLGLGAECVDGQHRVQPPRELLPLTLYPLAHPQSTPGAVN